MLAQGQAPPGLAGVIMVTNPSKEQWEENDLGWSMSHHRPHYLNPASAKHPNYPPITLKPTTGEISSNTLLPANLSHPMSLANSGQTGTLAYPEAISSTPISETLENTELPKALV